MGCMGPFKYYVMPCGDYEAIQIFHRKCGGLWGHLNITKKVKMGGCGMGHSNIVNCLEGVIWLIQILQRK